MADHNTNVSRRESLLALLDGEISSRFVPQHSVDWNAPQGTPSLVHAYRRARYADAHARRVLTHAMPGTGQPGVSVRMRADGCPFATARASDPSRRSNAPVAGYPS